jgi:hypothetical protein
MAIVDLLHLLFRYMWGHASTAWQRASTAPQTLLQVLVLLQQRGLLLLLLALVSQDVQQLPQLLRAPFASGWLLTP